MNEASDELNALYQDGPLDARLLLFADCFTEDSPQRNLILEAHKELLRLSSMNHGRKNKAVFRWEGRPIFLSPAQYRMALFLSENCDRIFTREELAREAWGGAEGKKLRSVDSQIKRIRHMIEEADPNFKALQTIYGRGYRWLKDPRSYR